MTTPKTEAFPDTELADPDDERPTIELITFLNRRIQTRDLLRQDLHKRQIDFRRILVELRYENTSLKAENLSLKTCNNQQKERISSLEGRICKLDGQIDSLLCKLNSANDAMKNMQQELRDKNKQLQQYMVDKQKIIQKCSSKIQAETDKMTKELETKLLKQREQLESYIKKKDDKLKLMKQILISDHEDTSDNIIPLTDSRLTTETTEKLTMTSEEKPSTVTSVNLQAALTSNVVSNSTATISKSKSDTEVIKDVDPSEIESNRLSRRDKIPVVNPRYRRSRSAEKWIDHRPAGMVPVGTILQPQTPRKRNVTKLINPKAFTVKSARYCLFAQEQDTNGELETKLYKADVLPTSGGGAQVVFNDIECLKQVSPIGERDYITGR